MKSSAFPLRSGACLILALLGPFLAPAQPAAAPNPTVTGTLNIDFQTVTRADADGNPPAGAADRYDLSLNVANSVDLHGSITRLPAIEGHVWGGHQDGSLAFDINTDVVNPKNPNQTKNIGKLQGTVPVNAKNEYHFTDGTVAINTFSIGTAVGMNAAFKGTAIGRPPTTKSSAMDRLKNAAISIRRQIQGQTVTMIVKNYDKMEFQQCVIAGGPVQIYPDCTVSGEMLYDYDRNMWHFHNFYVQYWDHGSQKSDAISGNIRWVEDKDRERNGKGEYDFDVRVNEPPPSEDAAFKAPTTEGDFFATDDSVVGLTGTMSYVDTFKGDPKDDNVQASAVNVDLTGNHLSKQQIMYLTKLLLLTAVVPMNSE